MYKIEKTKNYEKDLKSISKKLSNKKNLEKIEKSINSLLINFNFVSIPPRVPKLYQDDELEIWKIRIPNPDSNKGKSNGFRLFTYFIIKDDTFYLYAIDSKNNKDNHNDTSEYYKKEILNIFKQT